MREDTERQFQALLEQHDREFLKSATGGAERAFMEQEFDLRFHERIKDVVAPVMTKLRAMMHDHGLHAEIVVTRRRVEAGGKATQSSIAFEFRVLTDPETQGFPVTTPALAFIADPFNNNVQVHENTNLPFLGGHIGMIDRCAIDDLTGERVEKHLLAVARKVLRGTGVS